MKYNEGYAMHRGPDEYRAVLDIGGSDVDAQAKARTRSRGNSCRRTNSRKSNLCAYAALCFNDQEYQRGSVWE